MTPEKTSVPPKSAEEIEADAALDAACESANAAAKRLDASATSLKRTISGQMQAVRLPTPSQLELDVSRAPEKQ